MSTTFAPEEPDEAVHHSDALWVAAGTLSVAIMSLSTLLVYSKNDVLAPGVWVGQVAPKAKVMPGSVQVAAVPQNAANDVARTPTQTPQQAPRPAGKDNEAAAVAAATAVCKNCGSVESVVAIETSAPDNWAVTNKASSQVATILAALDPMDRASRANSSWEDYALEKPSAKKVTTYQVGVRMQDGSHRFVEVAQLPALGSAIELEGLGFRVVGGELYLPKSTSINPLDGPALGVARR